MRQTTPIKATVWVTVPCRVDQVRRCFKGERQLRKIESQSMCPEVTQQETRGTVYNKQVANDEHDTEGHVGTVQNGDEGV
jgi:hypothetical protein